MKLQRSRKRSLPSSSSSSSKSEGTKQAKADTPPPNPIRVDPSISSARTILVVGLSPASFKDELFRLWPKKVPALQRVRMVWLNSCDAPPELPGKWEWHEVHSDKAESLVNGDIDTTNWGELFVIMGAGTSIQDFTLLKASTDLYPFEKDLLQACSDVDVIDRSGTVLEPLCLTTLRFMAGLRKAYLEEHLPPFHVWLKAQAQESRVAGVLTFNIDSLEFVALGHDMGRRRIIQFHGNITQLTTIDHLAEPYATRPVTKSNPRVWSDPEALGRLACPNTSSLADVALLASSNAYMGMEEEIDELGGINPWHDRPRRATGMCAQAVADAALKIVRTGPKRGEAQATTQANGKPLMSEHDFYKVNQYLRSRVRQLHVGNCVYTGENNDAKVARAATGFLRAFAIGDTEFERFENELIVVNDRRGPSTASTPTEEGKAADSSDAQDDGAMKEEAD